MAELRDPTPVEQVVSAARKGLQLSTMDTRQRSYLKVGDSQMEWSLRKIELTPAPTGNSPRARIVLSLRPSSDFPRLPIPPLLLYIQRI